MRVPPGRLLLRFVPSYQGQQIVAKCGFLPIPAAPAASARARLGAHDAQAR